MNILFFCLLDIAASIPLAPVANKLAYLDPGSGSFIVQVLVASLLAGLLVIRSFWSRITGFFRRRPSDIPGDDGKENGSDSEDPRS